MNNINEASYGRIYQHTRDNGTFAIIGSEDKDTGQDRYSELKQLIKKYEKKYGHLGYNRLSGTYQYKLTGNVTNEKSVIIYNIDKKDALSIAKQINQESIIWKENTFFGIIDVEKETVLDRFKKSTLNFTKAIKQGIGSKLQSDQSRTFGYAFEGREIMKRTNLSESIRVQLHESEKSLASLAKFIEESVNDLQTTQYTNCRFILDENLAVYVGWSDGYGEESRDDVIQHKESPSWAICAAVKVRNDADWADFDYLDMPWYPEGEVWDTSVSIVPNDDYMSTADWLLKNYESIIKAHDAGEIFYTSEEEEEASEYNDNKRPWERY